MQVKNSREYDALTKELELQKLEIMASEKKIGQYQDEIAQKNEVLEVTQEKLKERKGDLKNKKKEFNSQ